MLIHAFFKKKFKDLVPCECTVQCLNEVIQLIVIALISLLAYVEHT